MRRYLPLTLLLACLALWPDAALAAGSNMPWEAPLQAILESIKELVAKIAAVIMLLPPQNAHPSLLSMLRIIDVVRRTSDQSCEGYFGG